MFDLFNHCLHGKQKMRGLMRGSRECNVSIKRCLTAYSAFNIQTRILKKLYYAHRDDKDCLTGCQPHELETPAKLSRKDAALYYPATPLKISCLSGCHIIVIANAVKQPRSMLS